MAEQREVEILLHCLQDLQNYEAARKVAAPPRSPRQVRLSAPSASRVTVSTTTVGKTRVVQSLEFVAAQFARLKAMGSEKVLPERMQRESNEQDQARDQTLEARRAPRNRGSRSNTRCTVPDSVTTSGRETTRIGGWERYFVEHEKRNENRVSDSTRLVLARS